MNCSWKHQENDFNDFAVQYLIPHKESTRGPKIAVGDVNKDGLDDFYACGAKGPAGGFDDAAKERVIYIRQTLLYLPSMPFAKMWMLFFLMRTGMDIRICMW